MARILVIDDDSDMRLLLEQTLGPAGHEVVSARDGREGIHQYRTEPAQLVITDLFMPNQEGLETIIQMRKDFPEVSIIAMSGRTGASTMLAIARRLGAIGVLEKPFDPDQLLRAVDVALRNAESRMRDIKR
jgi:DNA-binding NtrC family response regulator